MHHKATMMPVEKNHDAIPKECIPIGTKPIVDQENSDFFTSAKQYFISTQ
jgi:hypothetical protein